MNQSIMVWMALGIGVSVAACSTTGTTDPTADPQPIPEATDPPPEPGATPPAAPSADPCACPAACASKSENGWTVCNPGSAKAPDDLPAVETIGKFYIGNYEYWPYAKPSPYPDDTICGYNGDEACGWNGAAKGPPPESARRCMAAARKVLSDLLTKDVPPELEALRQRHGVNKFWNWNNDMTGTKKGAIPGTRDLWLYDGARADHGLIKWISETELDGQCHLPTRDDLVTFAKACVTDFPKCGSGK